LPRARIFWKPVAMNSSLKQFPIAAWRFLAVIAFALWIGGFTFHTAVTLRVGGDIIGGLEQGYVTQAALGKLHGFALAMVLVAALDNALHWRSVKPVARGFRCAAFAIMAVCVMILFQIHGDMSGLLDADAMTRPDKTAFSPLHERYQMFASVLWVTAMTELGMMLHAHRTR